MSILDLSVNANAKLDRYYDSVFSNFTEKLNSLFQPDNFTVETGETMIR